MKQLNFNLIDEIPRVSQIFISLEGEGNNAGEPSLYIRLAGCYSAACSFCDTKFSWYSKEKFPFLVKKEENKILPGEWIKELEREQIKHPLRVINRLTITGGEPLHYIENIKYLAEIFPELAMKYNTYITLLGIESNGNLLSEISNLLALIRTFKYFQAFGAEPQLTISPKIDAETCYENQLTQAEINTMYKKVYYNLENYFPFKNYYKFVWGVSKKMNNLVLQHIKELYKLRVDNNRIFLMPYTPKDPLGKNIEEWERSKLMTARKALNLGVRYSPRLHIDLNLD